MATLDIDRLRTATLTDGLDPAAAERVGALALAAFAANTRISYRWAWSVVDGWCARVDRPAMPMSSRDLALFLTWAFEAGYSPMSMRRFLVVVRAAHAMARRPDPTRDVAVSMIMRGASKLWDGTSQKKDAIERDLLDAMVGVALADRNGCKGVRDAALLLFGWALALRPDEIRRARREDVTIVDDLLVLTIPRSKGDRARRGAEVAMHRTGTATCPVAMLERWLALLPTEPEGAIFRKVSKDGRIGRDAIDDSSIRKIVKRLAKDAGSDADVAGHSMRVGWATTAFAAGLPDVEIMRHLRHAQIETSIGYDRAPVRVNLTRAVGL